MILLRNVKEIILRNVFIERKERDNLGYIYKISREIVKGPTIFTYSQYRIIIPYNFLKVVTIFTILTVLLNFVFHTKEINWFKSIIDLAYSFGMIVIAFMMTAIEEDVDILSTEIDRWWSYRHLDDQMTQIKSDIENQLEVGRYFRRFIKMFAIGYNTLPIGRFVYNGASNLADIRVIDGLPEIPWVYLEIVSGLITVQAVLISVSWIIIYLVSVTYICIAQLELAGVAFETIEERVLKTLEGRIDCRNDEGIYQEFVLSEIKSCARHYQTVYRLAKKLFQMFTLLTNYSYYGGCFGFIALGVLIAKEREDSFLLIQAATMVIATLTIQFMFSYVNDTLLDGVQNLKLTVYGTNWKDFNLSCQKNKHIMETMLMYCPKMTTFLGSEGTIEFLGKVINAGYYYITTILSMN